MTSLIQLFTRSSDIHCRRWALVKMFRQHVGSYKAECLKKTQTIILCFDEYTVYIMFWIMMVYDIFMQ
jgi:hypothetical protein